MLSIIFASLSVSLTLVNDSATKYWYTLLQLFLFFSYSAQSPLGSLRSIF